MTRMPPDRQARLPVGLTKIARRKRNAQRGGWTMVAVLVCLGVAMAITAAGMRTSLRARRQLNNQWQLEQTRLLLDVGIRRVQRLASEQPDYAGESWSLDGAFESFPEARVEIEALSAEAAGDDATRRFEVVSIIRNRDKIPVQTKRSRIVSVNQRESIPPQTP